MAQSLKAIGFLSLPFIYTVHSDAFSPTVKSQSANIIFCPLPSYRLNALFLIRRIKSAPAFRQCSILFIVPYARSAITRQPLLNVKFLRLSPADCSVILNWLQVRKINPQHNANATVVLLHFSPQYQRHLLQVPDKIQASQAFYSV